MCCCPSDAAIVRYAAPGKVAGECCLWKRGPRKGLATCVDEPDRHVFSYEWMDSHQIRVLGARHLPTWCLVPCLAPWRVHSAFQVVGLHHHRNLNCSRTGYEWRHGLARHTMTQDRWMASTKLQVGWCCDPTTIHHRVLRHQVHHLPTPPSLHRAHLLRPCHHPVHLHQNRGLRRHCHPSRLPLRRCHSCPTHQVRLWPPLPSAMPSTTTLLVDECASVGVGYFRYIL